MEAHRLSRKPRLDDALGPQKSAEECPELITQLLSLDKRDQPHLSASERLACFQACKDLWGWATTSTSCLGLKLNLGAATGGLGNRPPDSPTNALIVQQLAASSKAVALTLHKGVCSPAPCLWQAITTLSLKQVLLSADDFSSTSQLQLSNLPHLHTLRLQQCRMRVIQREQGSSTAQDHVGLGSGLMCPAVTTLEVINTNKCPDDHLPDHHFQPPPLSLVMSLLDPAQLHTLTTDDRAVIDQWWHLDQMTALQELHLLLDHPGVDDQVFQKILAPPSLLRVTLKHVSLKASCASTPCNWESLTVYHPAVTTLAALPLANIQHCTITSELQLDDDEHWLQRDNVGKDAIVQAAVSNVASCPRFTFEPSVRMSATDWDWDRKQPTFQLSLYGCQRPQQSVPLIRLALQHLAPGGALIINADVTLPEVLAVLATTPPTLTTICFIIQYNSEYDMDQGVVTHLPDHVTHVVLSLSEGCEWLDALSTFIEGVTRPLTLTLCNAPGRDDVWDEEGGGGGRACGRVSTSLPEPRGQVGVSEPRCCRAPLIAPSSDFLHTCTRGCEAANHRPSPAGVVSIVC